MNRRLLKKTIAWITIIIFLLGCSSTQRINSGEEFSIDKLATIVWRNNSKTATHHIVVLGDSIFAWEYPSSTEWVAHVADVQSIVVNDRGKGAIQGIKRGALAGAAIGFVVNASFGGDLLYGAEGAIVDVGLWGAYSGLFAGIILGSKTRYIFQPAITSASSLAENTNIGVENNPIPQSIQTGGDAPNNSDQESISEIEFVRAHLPVYLGPSFQVGLQFFEHQVQGIDESTSGWSMNWYTDRQFSTISDLTNILPGNPHRYYLNMAVLGSSGSGDIEGVVVNRHNQQVNVSMGAEGYRVGAAHNARMGFLELGLIYGEGLEYFYGDRPRTSHDHEPGVLYAVGHEHYFYGNRPRIVNYDYVGFGVGLAGGMRWYRRSLLGEIKITLNSRNRYLIPSFLVGYRF